MNSGKTVTQIAVKIGMRRTTLMTRTQNSSKVDEGGEGGFSCLVFCDGGPQGLAARTILAFWL